jgi:hypothetical protein
MMSTGGLTWPSVRAGTRSEIGKGGRRRKSRKFVQLGAGTNASAWGGGTHNQSRRSLRHVHVRGSAFEEDSSPRTRGARDPPLQLTSSPWTASETARG